MAVADNVSIMRTGKNDINVTVKMPITAELKGDNLSRFTIGDSEVKLSKQAQNTMYKGFWDKVKKQATKEGKELSKTLKGAAVVASDAAKQAIAKRTNEWTNKPVNEIIKNATVQLSASNQTNSTTAVAG